MPAPTNAITAEAIAHAMDVEMVNHFDKENNRLAEILGIFSPEVVAAGTARYLYKVEGALNNEQVGEGEEVALSKYELKKIPVGEHGIKKYRKLTTAEAILKSGYENAIGRTDDKMIRDAQVSILNEFFGFLAKGTGATSGETLQAALSQGEATLGDALEEHGDNVGRIVHFVNRFDIADYLANATITTQTVYGMTYIESFLGVNDIFVTSKVPKGKVYLTPADNIHMYGVDFSALSKAGLSYTTQDGSLVGVAHDPIYDRVSATTHMVTGCDLLAEITDYVVVSTIGAAGTPGPAALSAPAYDPDKAVEDMTVAELRAYAAERGIDLKGLTAKADILAAIQAAEAGE